MKLSLTCLAILLLGVSLLSAAPRVEVLRLPNNGVQPSAAVDGDGVLHVVYLAGEAKASDVFYVRRVGKDGKWSSPLRVNDRPGSAVAVGTVRGPQMTLGKAGAVHVVWNGSSAAGTSATGGAPLLVSRKLPGRDAFEPQRNIMTTTTSLDGGADIAADGKGRVFVAWHGNFVQGTRGEETRSVFLSTSEDDGAVFSPERVIDSSGNGACGCCGLALAADGQGNVGVIYRTARQKEQRNIMLLSSANGGKTFQERLIDTWRGNSCPMSTMNLIAPSAGEEWVATWEHAGQVHWAGISGARPSAISGAKPSTAMTQSRKHPSLAVGIGKQEGQLFVWAEGTAWQKGGEVAWEFAGASGPDDKLSGREKGLPVWGRPIAVRIGPDHFAVIF